MNSTYGPVVPEGQYPPFAVVTPDDHEAWILIATALGLVCTLFFGSTRLLVRLTISRGFRWDDYTLGTATLLAIIQSAIILGACGKGLGKSVSLLSVEAESEVQEMYYTSNLLFTIALGLSKISVVCFLLRLSPAKQHKVVFMAAIGLMAAWTVASLFAIALQCNMSMAWVTINQECPGVLLRRQVIGVFDILTEVLIVALAVYLVWSLRSSNANKVLVVGVFSFRLFTIVAIAFRLSTFDEAGWTTNPFLLEAPYIAWSQGQLNYSLVAATIPTFQQVLKNLNTGFGGLGENERSTYADGSRSESRLRKESTTGYMMSKLRTMNKSATVEEENEEDTAHGYQRPKSKHFANAGQHGDAYAERNGSRVPNPETLSINSDESQRLMIKKDTTWTVRTEVR